MSQVRLRNTTTQVVVVIPEEAVEQLGPGWEPFSREPDKPKPTKKRTTRSKPKG